MCIVKVKGLSERVVIWKYGFRNVFFLIIILVVNIFFCVLMGLVVIEWIFNIYGMGWLIIEFIG